jgi:transposase
MSKKELKRGEIIVKIMESKLKKKVASYILNLSLRQTYRLCKKYKKEGLKGLAHKRRGKCSNKKINSKTRKQVLELIRTQYTDFGPQLIKEQLEERHHLLLSREWIKKLMIEENIWKVNKRKNLPFYQRRERRSKYGELIQIDGSYEKWFEDRDSKCCLINMIDDATGKLQELRFVKHESIESYFKTLKSYLNNHKRPLALYSDRHMIFKSPKNNKTQFSRAMKELDIELIHANSP